MGNSASGKVILSNGAIFRYTERVTVAELMLEHPQHVVVEFEDALYGKRPTPLPADKALDAKSLYILLPLRNGKPVPLSSQEARQLLAKTTSVLKSIGGCVGGTGIGIGIGIGSCVNGDIYNDERGKVITRDDCFKEEMPEYLKRQISSSGRGWKPSLETITERAVAKRQHWLFF